jgi:hypothetical protein
MTLTPRWVPDWNAWGDAAGGEMFVGQAGEIDVYFQDHTDASSSVPEHCIYVVGPQERVTGEGGGIHNFDGYQIVDGSLVLGGEVQDIHIELSEMCEIYRLCVERGYIEEK